MIIRRAVVLLVVLALMVALAAVPAFAQGEEEYAADDDLGPMISDEGVEIDE
jgi:hypothetical protein